MKNNYCKPETFVVTLSSIMQVGPGDDTSTFDTNNNNVMFEDETNDSNKSTIWDTEESENQ